MRDVTLMFKNSHQGKPKFFFFSYQEMVWNGNRDLFGSVDDHTSIRF